MRKPNLLTGPTAFVTGLAVSAAARAQEAAQTLDIVGRPHAGGTGFQPAATSLAVDQQWLDHLLLWLCIGVVALVMVLLAVVILRFNARSNPKPSTFTHNTPLEITWTLIPVLILVVLAVFSLPVLFKQQTIPEADVTIKVTGNQWYWSYEYPDAGFGYDSYLIGHPATLGDEDAGAVPYVLNDAMVKRLERSGYTKDEFLLATDTAVVVPVGKKVVMLVTGSDVIHSWTVPAFAVKQDAVPGRTARLWFKPDREGVFFGQCSELCGKDHAFMPITVKVVSQAVYDQWLAASKAAGGYTEPAVQIAAAN
ncbi:MAG: cytochrome c oxidase subunit II [Rhodobacteraceae bacterium]|nr:cytochrome c oxidase subunit II [Paracoccaceae bacterium]